MKDAITFFHLIGCCWKLLESIPETKLHHFRTKKYSNWIILTVFGSQISNWIIWIKTGLKRKLTLYKSWVWVIPSKVSPNDLAETNGLSAIFSDQRETSTLYLIEITTYNHTLFSLWKTIHQNFSHICQFLVNLRPCQKDEYSILFSKKFILY